MWECSLKGLHAIGIDAVLDAAVMWLNSDSAEATICGRTKEVVTGFAQEQIRGPMLSA